MVTGSHCAAQRVAHVSFRFFVKDPASVFQSPLETTRTLNRANPVYKSVAYPSTSRLRGLIHCSVIRRLVDLMSPFASPNVA